MIYIFHCISSFGLHIYRFFAAKSLCTGHLRSMDAPAGELAGQEVDVVLLPASPRAVAGISNGRCTKMVQFRNSRRKAEN